VIPAPRLLGLKSTLKRAGSVALVTHRKPDGDALGSTLGLGLALAQQSKQVFFICQDSPPSHFKFLPGATRFVTELPEDSEALVMLDCGSDRMSGFDIVARSRRQPLIEIDHHPKSGRPASVRLEAYDANASSTAELVYEILTFAEWPIDRDIATCLLTGIISDTSAFQNNNVSSRTLEVAAALLRAGARRKEIVKQCFFTSSVPKLKLWGTAMARIEQNAGMEGLVSTVLTREDIEECGAHPDDVEGLVNFLNAIPGVPALLLLTDLQHGEVKGSFRTRSSGIDVSKLARLLGGGGHHQAAGFSVPGRLVRTSDDSWVVSPPETVTP